MLKYRRLSEEEFNLLEKDFIRFLAANSITAIDWQKLKSDSAQKVDELLDVFSNTVLEKVYDKAEYLLIVKPTEVHAFKMGDAKARLIGVRFKDDDLNLLKHKNFEAVFGSEKSLFIHRPELFSLEKKYVKPKSEEVFFLIKMGAEVVDEKFYQFLADLKKKL